jgi:hypothetical protein
VLFRNNKLFAAVVFPLVFRGCKIFKYGDNFFRLCDDRHSLGKKFHCVLLNTIFMNEERKIVLTTGVFAPDKNTAGNYAIGVK